MLRSVFQGKQSEGLTSALMTGCGECLQVSVRFMSVKLAVVSNLTICRQLVVNEEAQHQTSGAYKYAAAMSQDS